MEERAAVQVQAAGAQLPLRAEEEIVAQDAMLQLAERALGDQAEVRHVFLLLARQDPAAAGCVIVPRDRGRIALRNRTFAEAPQAGPKNGPKDTTARRLFH